MINWAVRQFNVKAGTIAEVRTADHHGTMLVAVTRASGGGMMVIGAGASAVELDWGCMAEGLAWLEKICAEADADRATRLDRIAAQIPVRPPDGDEPGGICGDYINEVASAGQRAEEPRLTPEQVAELAGLVKIEAGD